MSASLEPAAPATPDKLAALVAEYTAQKLEQREARARERAARDEAKAVDQVCSRLRDRIDRVIDELADPSTVRFHP